MLKLGIVNINKIIKGKSVVLVGAGQLGQMALDLWPTSIQKPILMLDSHRQGFLENIPIENTQSHRPSSSNVYVLSFFKESAEKVVSLFRDHFRQEIVTVYDLLTHFDQDRFSNGWSGSEKGYSSAQKVIQYLHDDYSKNVYNAAIEWRYKRNLLDTYPVSKEDDKYDIGKYLEDSIIFDLVVDGGSYDYSFGDTLIRTGFGWKKMIAFEPDPDRYKVVVKKIDRVGKLGQQDGQISVDNRAIWSDNKGCKFYSNGLLSARIAAKPDDTCILVDTVTLPDILNEHMVPNGRNILIKLHIEGAEWPVVKESKSLLEGNANINLLINLSHDEDSLVSIPKILGEMGKYNLYLESHSLFGEGLTLFASCQGK